MKVLRHYVLVQFRTHTVRRGLARGRILIIWVYRGGSGDPITVLIAPHPGPGSQGCKMTHYSWFVTVVHQASVKTPHTASIGGWSTRSGRGRGWVGGLARAGHWGLGQGHRVLCDRGGGESCPTRGLWIVNRNLNRKLN